MNNVGVNLHGYCSCGCPRTEDEAKGSQHWPEDQGGS